MLPLELPPPTPRHPLVSPKPGVVKRKRGGQPGNHNARKHGFYAARRPHPTALAIDKIKNAGGRLARTSTSIHARIMSLLDITSVEFAQMGKAKDKKAFRLALAVSARANKAIGMLINQRTALFAPSAHLQGLAADAYFLINYEFQDLDISEYPVFVPPGLENLSANSAPPGSPYLTDHQWHHLADLFLSLRQQLDSCRKYRRHMPLPSDRWLLNGILLKLATALPWCHLPAVYPSRACQQLYRHLYWSGCMRAIYNQLYNHLHVYGDTSLPNLIAQGCYLIENNCILLAPRESLTWQKFTTLLLLQRAYHNLRRLRREEDVERRRRGLYLRLPPLSRASSLNPSPELGRRATDLVSSGLALNDIEGTGLGGAGETALEEFEPLEQSLAWEKWQNITQQDEYVQQQVRKSKRKAA